MALFGTSGAGFERLVCGRIAAIGSGRSQGMSRAYVQDAEKAPHLSLAGGCLVEFPEPE